MQTPSIFRRNASAALTAFCLTLLTIGATVTVPSPAQAAACSAYVGVVA